MYPYSLFSQDTTFVKKHFFSNPVRNVFNGPGGIYVKTGDGLYLLNRDQWELINSEFKKNYVFYNKKYYESDYIPNHYLFDITAMKDLIPQRTLSNPTMAHQDNQLFVSTAGNLFEYFINSSYKRSFNGYSIRDIYFDKDFSVISTYDGIFFNDSIRAESPIYSSGEFQKIGDRYFLCNDQLYEMTELGRLARLEITNINVSGHFRKLLIWNKQIISQNTRSINFWDAEAGLIPIHQGEEYFDVEASDDRLLFCTGKGEVIQLSNEKFTTLCKVNSRIRDIYIYGEDLYICSDDGLYLMEDIKPKNLKKQNSLTNVVGVMMDLNKNLWITTENGLYVQPADRQFPIPFIPNVEFNRAALTIYNDQVYAGSVEGLFIIDIFNAAKNFLPQQTNTLAVGFNKILLISALTLIILSVLAIWFVKRRKNRKNVVIANTAKKNEERIITIDQMEQDIINQRIMTVESLADYYQTNSVQLNRILKSFNTTPGKILRQTKLKHAKELFKNNVPLHEISQKVGYSAVYLRSKF